MGTSIRLRHLLFFIITIMSVVPVILLGFGVKQPALDRELRAVEERHLQIAGHMTFALERYVAEARAVFQFAADQLRAGTTSGDLANLLSEFHFDHLCRIDANGRIIDRLIVPGAPDYASTTMISEPVRLSLRNDPDRESSHAISLSPVMLGIDGKPKVIVSGPSESDGSRVLGMLRPDYIVALQQSIKFGEKGHAAIVDQTGRVIAHPKENWRLEMRDLSAIDPVKRMKQGETGVTSFYSPALEQQMVAGFATVPGVGWGVMIPQPLDELERSAESIRTITLGMVLIGVLASALLSWYLAVKLTRPVVAVTRAAKEFAEGRHGEPIHVAHWLPSELTSLMGSFNAMVEKISRSERDLRRSGERMHDFATAAADWFWELDADLEFTYLSGRFEEVCGVPADALIGASPRQICQAKAENAREWEPYLAVFDRHEPVREMQFPWQRPDGEVRALVSSGTPRFDADGTFRGYRGAARDVTEEYRLAKKLRRQADHDDLTGLVNRREFQRRLESAVFSAKAHGTQHALCYMDLDQFKMINDTVGHVAGDALLSEVAVLLEGQVRERDTLARLGGDEFSLLLNNCPLEKAEEIAQALVDALCEHRFVWEKQTLTIGVSVGVVPISTGTISTVQLMSQADLACYTAKDLGRNRVHVLRPQDVEFERRHTEVHLATGLRSALDEQRFRLCVQRIQPLAGLGDEAALYEVLVRMVDPLGQIILPDAFIPAAQRFGMMGLVDRWVIRTTLANYHQLRECTGPLQLSINLSAGSLGDDTLLQFVHHALHDHQVPGSAIGFEITETSAIGSIADARRFMLELKRIGCRFGLDDFGSGLASFSYLRELPVDYLKIDGSFVQGILARPVDRAMVEAIHQVAAVLEIQTIAECVDTTELLEALRALGIDAAQGFAIHSPEYIDEIIASRRTFRPVRVGDRKG